MLPSGTSTLRPSSSISTMSCRPGSLGGHRDHAGLVFDVVGELVAEVLEHALHRHRGGIAERADGATLDVVGHRVEQREVFRATLAVLDAIDHAPQPAGAFAARRALAAALVLVEVGQAQQALDHAATLVHHDDGA